MVYQRIAVTDLGILLWLMGNEAVSSISGVGITTVRIGIGGKSEEFRMRLLWNGANDAALILLETPDHALGGNCTPYNVEI